MNKEELTDVLELAVELEELKVKYKALQEEHGKLETAYAFMEDSNAKHAEAADWFERKSKELQGLLGRAKAEVKTLQKARQRGNYLLNQKKTNAQRLDEIVRQMRSNTENAKAEIMKAISWLNSYLRMKDWNFVALAVSPEGKQFSAEKEMDKLLDEPLLQGDTLFSWFVKKALAELSGNGYRDNLSCFFELLPSEEDDFVEPLMNCFIEYCKHPNVENPSEERLETERLRYSNLYRKLIRLKGEYERRA